MSDCNNSSFEIIKGNTVSYGVAHPILGIKDTDCLKEAFNKLALKVEYLIENMCSKESISPVENTYFTESDKAIVDYTISPIITSQKGEINNRIQIDWTNVELQGNDTLVQKTMNVYSGGTLIASSSKSGHVIDFKPKDYPLDVEVSAIVTTESGTIKTSRMLRVSADEATTYAPLLEIKKDTVIQDKNIAVLNSELIKIKTEINEIKTMLL